MDQLRYPSKTWVFKNGFSFKVRKHRQKHGFLHFHNPNCALQSPLRVGSSTLVNFHLPISPLLVHKIPTKSPFLCTSVILHLLIFAYNHTNNLHQKYFPYLSHLAISDCANGPGSQGPSFWEYGQVITGVTITDFLSLRLR